MSVDRMTLLLDRAGFGGGAERYWRMVVPRIRAAGIAVRVLARAVDDDPRFGPDVHRIAWGGDDGHADPAAAEAVRAALRDHGGIAITASVFDVGVLDAVRSSGLPWIARLHDHRAFCPNGDRTYPQFPAVCTRPVGTACRINTVVRGCVSGPRPASFARIAHRLALRDRLRTADALFVSSTYMRESAAGNGIDPTRIAITPPPLSENAYAAQAPPRPASDSVLFSGRLAPQKGLRSLIAGLAAIPATRRPRLVVAGSGPDEAAARADAERLGVATTWAGWLDSRALRAAIDAATLVAVPTLEPEPFGLVGTEAQARSRPAVAYAVGGIPEWIADAGFTVPRGDVAALGTAIERALEPATWERLATAARRASERYRVAPHVERFLALAASARSRV